MSEHTSSPQETWDYIDGLERLGIKLGLERVTKLVKELGSPQKAYKTIHVVGTNGKTSTTRFISSLLEAQGHTVGAYVSPHLVSLAERQMVNSVPSTDEEFCELVDRVRPAVEKVDKSLKGDEKLTQFEVLTAAALLYFKEKGCDVAVIEAGLGGRLDATAVIILRRAGAHQHRAGAHRAAGRHPLQDPDGEGRGHPQEGPGGRGHPGRGPQGGAPRTSAQRARPSATSWASSSLCSPIPGPTPLTSPGIIGCYTRRAAQGAGRLPESQRRGGGGRCGAVQRGGVGGRHGAHGSGQHSGARAVWKS